MKIFPKIGICLLLAGSLNLQAQTEGIITYEETHKLDIQLGEGTSLPDDFADLMPKQFTSQKDLLFNSTEAIYVDRKDNENQDFEMESDDGSFKMVIMSDESESILYQNFAEKTEVNQQGIMSKNFLIESDITKSKWRITPEKVKFQGYECQKAELEIEGKLTVAWFTPQIPVSIGPSGYHGLPGAILMVSEDDGKREIKALEINLKSLDKDAIKRPTKGKKVTQEAFDKIVKEREIEMSNMFQGRTRTR